MQPVRTCTVYHRAADVPDFLGGALELIDGILHHLGSFVLRRAETGDSKLYICMISYRVGEGTLGLAPP